MIMSKTKTRRSYKPLTGIPALERKAERDKANEDRKAGMPAIWSGSERKYMNALAKRRQ